MIDENHKPAETVASPASPQTGKRSQQNPHKDTLRNFLSTLAVLLIAPAIAILLTAFVFQSYQVDGPSMQTTLYTNDRLIVWKLPETWSHITGHSYIPKRGDIIVFTENLSEFGQSPNKQLIKRVIGLPGDTIVVKDNVLTVFNAAHPNGFRPDTTLPYGSVIHDTPIDGTWVIGKNQLFVCGDNRGNSLDSRTFGPINANHVVGKLVARILPVSQAKRF